MEIKGKVHCFFEQSGTFKNEFIKLGIPAEDYDIQNNFGETDHVIDLFAEIESAYRGGQSIFDSISCDDLIMAFFPCIYFDCMSQLSMGWYAHNYKRLSVKEKADKILERGENRERFWRIAVKMFAVCDMRGLRIIMENPFSMQTFLRGNFLFQPTIIDNDRTLRGDIYKKPTGYWYLNCEPTTNTTIEKLHKARRILDEKGVKGGGICNETRSMITKEYALNFICDFILGKEKKGTQLNLFD